MPKHSSNLHIDVMGNGVRMHFTPGVYRKMLRAPFADDVIRESQYTWLLAPIAFQDPAAVADDIVSWAMDQGIEISR